MAAPIPLVRNTIALADVLTSSPVRGPTTWVDFAKLNNWTLGRGAMLVPAYSPLITLTNGSEHLYSFRTRPRYQAIERRLFLRLRGASTTDCAVEFPSGATSRTVRVVTDRENVANEVFTHTLSAQAETEDNITLAMTPSAAGVIVEGIGIWEVARTAIAVGGSDRGSDPAKLAVGQPIMRDSLEGAFEIMNSPDLIGRRVGLWQWAVPYDVGGATSTAFAEAITSTSYVNVFSSGVPMLTRKLNRSATTGTATLKVLAWVTGGTGDVRLVSSVHGNSTAISVSATTPTWSSSTTLSIDCEDETASDGRRSSAWDMVSIEARKNVSGTLYIASVSVWEA